MPVRKRPAVQPSAFSLLPSGAALILFAKAPVPGQVKTRLCPPLTPDEAAGLHGSFVLDALERSRAVRGLDRFLACAPSADHVFFKIMEERQGVRLMSQEGGDLGARMTHALKAALALGYRHVVMAGTDLPTLSPAFYTQALDLLARHDVVLGPALDGGYYLVGLNQDLSELFAGIPWSTDQVLARTKTKADSLGLKTGLLPACRDVDTIEDLLALIAEDGANLSKRTAGALRLLAERLRHR
jgi:rSAM/selenodomain-associated transferase 1